MLFASSITGRCGARPIAEKASPCTPWARVMELPRRASATCTSERHFRNNDTGGQDEESVNGGERGSRGASPRARASPHRRYSPSSGKIHGSRRDGSPRG